MTMTGTDRRALISAIAGANGSRFVSVTWHKDDGDERTAVVNPRDFTGVKGKSAAPSAQQAVATRKETNPDLWNVIDRSKPNRSNGSPPWVSIRCRGKIRIRQGKTYDVTVDLG